MTDSECILEPRDNVDQIENKPRTVAVPRTHGVLEWLERKSTGVKRLASLWGPRVRFPVENRSEGHRQPGFEKTYCT